MENTNETNNSASVEKTAGSAEELISGPVKGDIITGQPAQTLSPKNEAKVTVEETVSKAQYEELEKKLGTQGKELGEYREWLTKVKPFLDKLDEQPELIEAINDGKVDNSLAKAVLEGKFSIKEAETVTKAHEEVKKDIGTENYNALKPEEIKKLVMEEIDKSISGVKKDMDEDKEFRNWEKKSEDFMSSTPDFPEYAEEISKWLDEHNIDDVEIAYNAVKGIVLDKKIKEAEQKGAGEAAKAAAADLSGGPSQNASVVQDKKIVDELIGGRTNPNIF